ncbi:MAG: hypothetical protein QY326_00605 [Bdellovibrionota bacterium]|nr:MAG: hypothetical protein QY326_00605 [Bdellovibrionota bacterium]
MLGVIKSWFQTRELVALSYRKDLSAIEPVALLRLLEVVSHYYQSREAALFEVARTPDIEMRDALARIWELARDRYRVERASRLAWHRVMANCNSLYEQCGGMPVKAPISRQRAA